MIRFDLRQSVTKNAATYFDKSKKLKQKIEGIDKTIAVYSQKKDVVVIKEQKELSKPQRKAQWFEKFRWFYTSKGHLCIGGRDAHSNESIIKKYTQETDLVFHTEGAGSPFFVLKLEANEAATEEELEEIATVTACYSRAWKSGLAHAEVFYVRPEQVTKEANSGEYISTGSFVIRGKTTHVRHTMKLAVGLSEGIPIVGSKETIAAKCDKFLFLIQGEEKASDTAKKLQKLLKGAELDDYIKIIPPGGAKIVQS